MQSAMVRMARSRDSEDRMVQGGGREATSLGKAHAHAMEDYRTYCWENGYTMSGEIPEAVGRSGG